jgi:hypothetical protein
MMEVLEQMLGVERYAEFQKFHSLIADAYVRMATNNNKEYVDQQMAKVNGWFGEMVKIIESLETVTYGTGGGGVE